MLNEILDPFKDFFSFLNLFEYITFRAGASAILSLLISFIFGLLLLKKMQISFDLKGLWKKK